MPKNSLERLSIALVNLLSRIDEYCIKQCEHGQPFGACTVNPKHALVPTPTNEIKLELERRATEHFNQTKAVGYYFRYWTPPILPILTDKNGEGTSKPITADDYQMSLELPQFDNKWQQTIIARSLIYCPLEQEQHGWSDWFELQLEAIRLTPLLHQTLNELQIRSQIKVNLELPAQPIFHSFVYEYALNDRNFPPMTKEEVKLWMTKKIDWKSRYQSAAVIIKPATTLKTLYTIARKKASSTRNPILKPLFEAFVEKIETMLIYKTDLPEEEKRRLIFSVT